MYKNKDGYIDFKYEDGSNIFFTSDLHFHHDNIIKFCKRPFKNADEMDDVLVKNWNSTVNDDSNVFILGDFAFGGSVIWHKMGYSLKGHKHLIIGNHDLKNLREGYRDIFESIEYQMQIEIEGRKIYLNHYPFLCYGGAYRGDAAAVWQLFGHVHSTPFPSDGKEKERLKYLFPTQYDVGVDNNNFTPVSFYQVKDIIEKQIKNKTDEQQH